MWLSEPLPFIEDFVGDLDKGLRVLSPKGGLSNIQRVLSDN
jgi:hypothetical protein